ncbi:MAG: hypothetical protein EXQ67_06965 [Thermoleophilia bacterium]|nr:hypothetical protein [Thermoleophilia bacterium]
MNRVAQAVLPVAFGLAGLVLLAAALAVESASALAAAALITTLMLAAVADPPTRSVAPRRRALGRITAAAAALTLGTISVVAGFSAGFGQSDDWAYVALAGGFAALVLLAPLAVLWRAQLELPILQSERTSFLRGAAVGLSLAVGVLIGFYVLPAVEAAVAVGFGLIAVLEGVALARPGGAGLRRVSTVDETRAVEAAIAHGPAEVIGFRRIVVRRTGGAEYLSVEALLRQKVTAARAVGIRTALESVIKSALPNLVISVRLRVADEAKPIRSTPASVLPSAPWKGS